MDRLIVKILILPKFTLSTIGDGKVDEAELYYNEYLKGGKIFDINGASNKLYFKDGIALIVTGMGKVNSSSTLTATLIDSRFDFSSAYILDVGCTGCVPKRTIMGETKWSIMIQSSEIPLNIGLFRKRKNRKYKFSYQNSRYESPFFVLPCIYNYTRRAYRVIKVGQLHG